MLSAEEARQLSTDSLSDAIKSGEFQVTFECKNSNITHEVIAELKKEWVYD